MWAFHTQTSGSLWSTFSGRTGSRYPQWELAKGDGVLQQDEEPRGDMIYGIGREVLCTKHGNLEGASREHRTAAYVVLSTHM